MLMQGTGLRHNGKMCSVENGTEQNEPWHDKTNKMRVRPVKTQIRLGGSDQSLHYPHEESLGP